MAACVARHWRSFRVVVPGFVALGITLLAATLIHADRFRWGYPPTWIWTFVYAVLPPAAIYFWRLQSAAARGVPVPERDRRLAPISAVSGALGVVLTVAAGGLFVAPDALLAHWAWTLTPLLSRVLAGWCALAGGTLLYLAASVRRSHEVPIPCATLATWSALMLLLPLLHRGDVDTGATAFWPWIGLHAALLAACAWMLVRSLRLMGADGARI